MNIRGNAVALGLTILTISSVAPAQTDSTFIRNITQGAPFVSGYDSTLAGVRFDYHSVNEFVRDALLVRATDGTMLAEWLTATVPPVPKKTSAVTFAWLAALSGSKGAAPFVLSLNGDSVLTFTTPPDSLQKTLSFKGSDGIVLTFVATEADRFQDMFGYMFLKVPVRRLPKAARARLRIQGSAAETQAWTMMFQHPLTSAMRARALPALVRARDTLCQELQLDVEHYGEPKELTVMLDSLPVASERLSWGVATLHIPVPSVSSAQLRVLSLVDHGTVLQSDSIFLRPVTPRTLYLLSHSHTDIGYSAPQAEVQKNHCRYIDMALDLIDKSRDYPEGARFKWNLEVAWELDSYLRQATPEQRTRLVEAIRSGSVGVNALYTNTLTGIQGPEELLRETEFARNFAKEHNLPLTTAMITDIPSYSWSTVTALGLAGVKYLSSGPNYQPQLPDLGDRIGGALKAWGDKPFRWFSSNGEHNILLWMAGKGYSWFHGWILGRLNHTKPRPIFDYVDALDSARYPYDMVQVRYTVDGDNGPPDDALADFVHHWNDTYVSPRLVISTTDEMFAAFDRKYGEQVPVQKGDLTPYWEDGAASSARELAMNRESAELLNQSEALAALTNAVLAPRLSEAWRSVLLFSEHTWGAWNSISEPDSPAVRAQWDIKRAFAEDGSRMAKEIFSSSASAPQGDTGKVEAVEVVNTNIWPRNDVAVLPAARSSAGDRVLEEGGTPTPSQRLSDGSLAFLAREIPPLGSRRYHVVAGLPVGPRDSVSTQAAELKQGTIALRVDEHTGAIASLRWGPDQIEYVDTTQWSGLAGALYVPGRNPHDTRQEEGAHITIADQGALVGTLVVTSTLDGMRSVRRAITLFGGLDRVDITTTFDKLPVRTKESLHMAFPFRVQEGKVRFDLGWEVMTPGEDQLTGSNKDFFCVQRWADVSNSSYGVTLTSGDTPLFEVGELTDETLTGASVRTWRNTIPVSQTIAAYVMNNYWHTNYKADQEGPLVVRQSVLPHAGFDQARAERLGIERSQPLVIRFVKDNDPPARMPITVIPTNLVLTHLSRAGDQKGWVLRLMNPGPRQEDFLFRWSGSGSAAVYESNLAGDRVQRGQLPITIPPMGVRTIRVDGSQ
jgi:alpha-mannosidase